MAIVYLAGAATLWQHHLTIMMERPELTRSVPARSGNLEEDGFALYNDIYTEREVQALLREIDLADTSRSTFRKSASLFAIRRFLHEIPAVKGLVFNERVKDMLKKVFGGPYFVVKSIYFDKPPGSNWYVSYHQDLTISVAAKTAVRGYHNWTRKEDQFAVQPPVSVLEQIITVRIHLDDTDERNGALYVVPGSHRQGIYRPETIDWNNEKEVVCKVSRGSIMLMKPLLLHSSRRTLDERQRRVIHIECSGVSLPPALHWSEYMTVSEAGGA